MYEFPDELWRMIRDFQLDYKKYHHLKMLPVLDKINNSFREIHTRWTLFPPFNNTNDIINQEYPGEIYDWMIARPQPNMIKTSICWNVSGNGGWYCGYGWEKIK